ncbi:MAG: class A beta-lactamase, subclass A2 [Bacteroidetes bacterium]|nr:class A beta-lactamase, subclass A2 [Bacteroidota bacterium]
MIRHFLKLEFINYLSRQLFFLFVVISLLANTAKSQNASLRQSINQIINTIDGKVGVAVMNIEKKDTLSINGHSHFPMQSVFKFPLAMAVFQQVDQGQFSLDQKIHIEKKDLQPNFWSPLREKYPNGNVDISLSELLKFTVSESDNSGCDLLFRLLGGPIKVDKIIHSLGVKEIAIVATEEEMHKEWDVQYTNWCEPMAMIHLLEILNSGKALSKSNNDFLLKLMTETTIGAKRIKGLLPKGTVVAHKTGLSDTNALGITAATHDVGIVTLPDGNHLAIVVFVSNSKANQENRERIIAQIAKVVWDYYVK